MKRTAKNIVKGFGTVIDIAPPSPKKFSSRASIKRAPSVKSALQSDWIKVSRSLSTAFESEVLYHGRKRRKALK